MSSASFRPGLARARVDCYLLPVSADARIGSEILGYRIEELLGRGGMGAVYRAEDVALGRKVALKLLVPDLAEDERFRERFLRESRLAASLDHQNIVPIYQAGEADGLLYIAMRYVEGTDLRKLIAQEGRLDPARAVGILDQVADALDAAHERALVHRDVKPANILIARRAGRDHCYLADFGLTKQTSSLSGLTATGQLVGTVDYVPPEQVKGETVDGRADVYSLACVLYECLAGSPPFERENEVATLWAHVQEEPQPLSKRRPDLPRRLDAVLEKGLAKAPGERYRTAGELVGATRTALGLTGETQTMPVPWRRREIALPRVIRRHRKAALGVALAAVAAIAAALLVPGLFSSELSSVSPNSVGIIDADSEKLVDEVAVGERPGAVAVGGGSVWVANTEDKTLSRIDPETREERRISLDATPTGVAVGPGGVWVAHGLLGTLTRIDPQFNEPGEPIEVAGRGTAGTVTVGGGSVWVAYGESTVARVNADTGRVVETTFAGSSPAAIAFGERSLWVVNSGDNTVSRFNPRTFSESTRTLTPAITVGRSPRGIAIGGGAVWVSNSGDDTVSRIDPASNSTTSIQVGDGPTGMAFGKGSVWVVNSNEGTVSRIDPSTNEVAQTIDVRNLPDGIAVANESVWVTVQAP